MPAFMQIFSCGAVERDARPAFGYKVMATFVFTDYKFFRVRYMISCEQLTIP